MEQVSETIMGLFDIHSIAVARIYDMPTIAESTWHGACLACAEIARRGLVSDNQMSTLVDWLSKVIYYKGYLVM
jgi:tubulin-specific chaperone D